MTADRPLRTSDFEYPLPPELIAQTPGPERGDSRLLVVPRGGPPEALEDRRFADLPGLIPAGDLVVLNSTRVRHARLLGSRPSGAPAEVLLIHPSTDGSWIAIGKPGSALRAGKRITLGPGSEIETIEVLPDGERRVVFVGLPAADAIAQHGRLPLPPYIERAPTREDEERYQTVYADREGSVAAPTAGLHFTDAILEQLRGRGVRVASLDLEVGPGTFKPVEEDDIAAHPMHPERYEIPAEVASEVREARARGAAVWAIGTTVVRALESAARPDGTVAAGAAETRLLIAPGYQYRVVDHLVTNFHLPRSTLLMLVAAFAGYETMMTAYRHAVRARYRFYSYGDAMCIL